MAKISFLIGSGFSVPAEYPTTTQLNQRLYKIDSHEICVHTSRDAWFLNGQQDLNASWMGVEERQYVQEFLEFYNSKVLKFGEKFHYETFYDYYITAYLNDSYSNELLDFLTNFKRKNKVTSDFHHIMMKFNDTFSQLLANLLTKPLEQVHYCKPYDYRYNGFLLLVEELAKTYTIHFHTLNHDVYLETFSSTDSMQGLLDDGFDELGSNVYALKYDKYAKYMIRLRRFIDKYEKPFCLYKLHGSIDNYWCSYEDKIDLVKIPWGVSSHEIHKEVVRNGKLEYVHRPSDIVADFLSGTSYKIERYEDGKYYPLMLEHFCTNLKESDVLIVVGYGFGDSRINTYLDQHYFRDLSKVMFIVDVTRQSTVYLNHPNTYFIEGGVTAINPEFVLDKIKRG